MRFLSGLRDGLIRVETLALGLLLLAATGLSFSQVLLRQFQGGLLWADPLIRHMVLWIAFLGGALATAKGQHIAIDALGRLARGKVKVFLHLLSSLLGLLVCLLLARAGWTFLEFEQGGPAIAGIPRSFVLAVIPWGFALIAFHFLLDLPLALTREKEERP